MKWETILRFVIVMVVLIAITGGLYIYEVKTREQFIKKMKPIAKKIKQDFGIDEKITITQSAHESNYGRSELAQKGLNLFGIRPSSDWLAQKRPTYSVGEIVYKKYNSWQESADDWAELLSGFSRYAQSLYYAKLGDIDKFAEAIGKSGYAEDPAYSEKIKQVGRDITKLI